MAATRLQVRKAHGHRTLIKGRYGHSASASTSTRTSASTSISKARGDTARRRSTAPCDSAMQSTDAANASSAPLESDVSETDDVSGAGDTPDDRRRQSSPDVDRNVFTVGSRKITTHVKQNDVLLGRGTGPSLHGGNVLFRSLVRDAQAEYTDSQIRGDKIRIARDVIRELHDRNARFLRKLDPHEIPDSMSDVARAHELYLIIEDDPTLVQKTKQAFRHFIKQQDQPGHHQHQSTAFAGLAMAGGELNVAFPTAVASDGATAIAIPVHNAATRRPVAPQTTYVSSDPSTSGEYLSRAVAEMAATSAMSSSTSARFAIPSHHSNASANISAPAPTEPQRVTPASATMFSSRSSIISYLRHQLQEHQAAIPASASAPMPMPMPTSMHAVATGSSSTTSSQPLPSAAPTPGELYGQRQAQMTPSTLMPVSASSATRDSRQRLHLLQGIMTAQQDSQMRAEQAQTLQILRQIQNDRSSTMLRNDPIISRLLAEMLPHRDTTIHGVDQLSRDADAGFGPFRLHSMSAPATAASALPPLPPLRSMASLTSQMEDLAHPPAAPSGTERSNSSRIADLVQRAMGVVVSPSYPDMARSPAPGSATRSTFSSRPMGMPVASASAHAHAHAHIPVPATAALPIDQQIEHWYAQLLNELASTEEAMSQRRQHPRS